MSPRLDEGCPAVGKKNQARGDSFSFLQAIGIVPAQVNRSASGHFEPVLKIAETG